MSDQLLLFEDPPNDTKGNIDIESLFQAYSNCRKNKRSSEAAIALEIDYESLLLIEL